MHVKENNPIFMDFCHLVHLVTQRLFPLLPSPLKGWKLNLSHSFDFGLGVDFVLRHDRGLWSETFDH